MKQKKPLVFWIIDHNFCYAQNVDLLLADLLKRLKSAFGDDTIVEFISNTRSLEEKLASIAEDSAGYPDLVITECDVPISIENAQAGIIDYLSGFFYWYQLRRKAAWGSLAAGIPVVFFTYCTSPEISEAVKTDPLTRWLSKPAGAETIISLIHELLDRVEQANSDKKD